MPDLTTKLGLKKPLGNEAVNRLAYNENLDLIDVNAASQSELDEHKNSVDPHPQYKKDTDAPINHAASHASGGTDPVTPASIDAAPLSHVGTGGTAHAVVTTSVNGFMTATDKTKLNGIETGATADQTASEILTLLKTVDGVGSGLDAQYFQGKAINDFFQVVYDSGEVTLSDGSTTGISTLAHNLGYIPKNGLLMTKRTDGKWTMQFYNNSGTGSSTTGALWKDIDNSNVVVAIYNGGSGIHPSGYISVRLFLFN